ncbi:hypothetical protein [Paenibacillus timonensis]|uniref:hypothetical protein n=1 Tax=Paenibacillus timonensis TaxID=225915 RepID=UPI003F9445CC
MAVFFKINVSPEGAVVRGIPGGSLPQEAVKRSNAERNINGKLRNGIHPLIVVPLGPLENGFLAILQSIAEIVKTSSFA